MLYLFTAPHWCIMDINRINVLLGSVSCPHCQCQETVHVTTGSHKGFALPLTLVCSHCDLQLGSTYSSPVLATGTNPQPFAINDIMVLLFNHLGLGYTAVKEFCGILGIPAMHVKTFQEKEKKVIEKTMEVASAILQKSADIVRTMHEATNPGDEDEHTNTCITVSFDGTWQKRGHASMHGVAAVIDVVTGLVVDYEVLSMYCHSCSCKKAQLGADSPAFTAWYAEHQNDCSINYHGSSNAMEVEAAKRLWGRSVQTNGLMYTGMLGDGDSKAYQAVVQLEPYGPDVEIVREECVNHAHKRMGTALLKLSREKKLGGRGRGRGRRTRRSDEGQGDPAATLLPLRDHCKWRRCRQHAGQGVGHSVPLHEYRRGAPPHSLPSWHRLLVLLPAGPGE